MYVLCIGHGPGSCAHGDAVLGQGRWHVYDSGRHAEAGVVHGQVVAGVVGDYCGLVEVDLFVSDGWSCIFHGLYLTVYLLLRRVELSLAR